MVVLNLHTSLLESWISGCDYSCMKSSVILQGRFEPVCHFQSCKFSIHFFLHLILVNTGALLVSAQMFVQHWTRLLSSYPDWRPYRAFYNLQLRCNLGASSHNKNSYVYLFIYGSLYSSGDPKTRSLNKIQYFNIFQLCCFSDVCKVGFGWGLQTTLSVLI